MSVEKYYWEKRVPLKKNFPKYVIPTNQIFRELQAPSNQLSFITSDNPDKIVVDWSSGQVDSDVNISSNIFVNIIIENSRGELRAKVKAGDLLGKSHQLLDMPYISIRYPPKLPEREIVRINYNSKYN